MAAGRYNLTVLQRDNDAKRRIIEAINYEDSQSIYPSSLGFKSAHESIVRLAHQLEPRHEDAIFKIDSSISPETTGRGDCDSTTRPPIYKSLKVGDRVLATVDLPLHMQDGGGGPGAARRTHGTVFATVKAVIHSGFSSARYDILLDGPECSQKHGQTKEGLMGQESGRKRLLRDNPNLVTVSWSSLQVVTSEPPLPTSMLPPPLSSRHLSGQSTAVASLSRHPGEMVIPQPPPPPPPPPHFPPPPVPPRSESRQPVTSVGAAEPAPPVPTVQGAQRETPNSEPTPSSLQSSAALLNPSLFAGRAKGGWRSTVRKP